MRCSLFFETVIITSSDNLSSLIEQMFKVFSSLREYISQRVILTRHVAHFHTIRAVARSLQLDKFIRRGSSQVLKPMTISCTLCRLCNIPCAAARKSTRTTYISFGIFLYETRENNTTVKQDFPNLRKSESRPTFYTTTNMRDLSSFSKCEKVGEE